MLIVAKSPCCSLLSPLKVYLRRNASTLTPEVPYWPKSTDPSPYEILGIARSQNIDSQTLKRKYKELCKIYHPDLSRSKLFLDHKGQELNDKVKEARFKQINNAYNLLKDPSKRGIYNQFQTGWDTSYAGRQYHQAYANSPRYNQHDDRFWHAGNWEDHANMKHDSRKEDDPIFKAHLAKKNREVLLMTIGIALFVFCGQLAYALDNYRAEKLQVELTNQESNNFLFLAYINHGLGLDKWSRLKNFLWSRRYNLYKNNEEELSSQEAEDKKLIQRLQDKKKN